MPLQIIKQNITTIHCDVIVDPTDSVYSGSGGADYAIHHMAGKELDAVCSALPPLEVASVEVTDAFELPCDHILHTMGPVWNGGDFGELALLRSCYINALIKAVELKAESIAFPLISAGTFGVPKDKVLRVASNAIGDFLSVSDREMHVYICVTNRASYEIGCAMELEQYLSERYLPRRMHSLSKKAEPRDREAEPDIDFFEKNLCSFDSEPMSDAFRVYRKPRSTSLLNAELETIREQAEIPNLCCSVSKSKAAPPASSLSHWIKLDYSFKELLLKLIDAKGMTDVECYQKANVSKQTFSKIINKPGYRPSKQTVVSFAIALKLTLEETRQLLDTVGFSLSHSLLFDMIIEYFIVSGCYNIFEINEALYKYDQSLLGC